MSVKGECCNFGDSWGLGRARLLIAIRVISRVKAIASRLRVGIREMWRVAFRESVRVGARE